MTLTLIMDYFNLTSLLSSRCLSVLKPELVVAPNRRRRPSSLSRWASRTLSPSPSTLSATASARTRPSPTAPNATMATAPSSAASASATRVAWGRTASVPRGTITPRSRTAAAGPRAPEDPSLPSAVAGGTVCADSVCVTTATLERSGESCVSVTTSTACATRGICAQVRSCFLSTVGA